MIFETTAGLTQWPLHWSVPITTVKSPKAQYRQRYEPADIHSGNIHTGLDESERVNLAASCLVYIPRSIAMRNTTAAFQYLVHLSGDREFMAGKLHCIAEVAFQLQYSLPDADSSSAQYSFNWPLSKSGTALSNRKDAVDVLLDHLLAT